jgi:sigma-54 dependent transcriptional regulator, acetoin dehydrogenase operon transcriptional activator AcoR
MSGRVKQSSSVLMALKERVIESGAVGRNTIPAEIQRSWRRCADQGLSLAGRRAPERLSSYELKERAMRFERLVNGAAPIMHHLSHQISNTRSMVLLSDPQGLILHSVGDDDFISRAERVALKPGVRWDEETKGTNAIGTAAVERTAVLVHAAEHYVEQNQFLTCSASPIFDGFGDLAGVLDISGDYRSYQDHTLALVRLGAQMIEDRLFEEAAAGYHLARFHPQRAYLFSVAEGRAAFDDCGKLIALNHTGREMLNTPACGESFEQLFGLPFEQAISRSQQFAQSLLSCTLPRGVTIALSLQIARSQHRVIHSTSSLTELSSKSSSPTKSTHALHPSPADIGRHDQKMAQVVERARRVMASGIPLLIEGESGSGKEWVARSLHDHGTRSAKPFVAVNCAAIPDTLIESELFGYEDGAFTGARKRGSLGKIREANGGTLFLDEIGDMPLAMQARLLRVLQDRAVNPLGSGRSFPIDINVVCATHRNLRELVAEGSFREDLFYRLNGFNVHLPALRERQDLRELVNQLLSDESASLGITARVNEEVMQLLITHPWPGNIRQLRNVIRTGIALMDDSGVMDRFCLADDFLSEFNASLPINPSPSSPLTHTKMNTYCASPVSNPGVSLDEAEWKTMEETLMRCGGNVSAAAKTLGISRNRLYRKIRQFSPTHNQTQIQ